MATTPVLAAIDDDVKLRFAALYVRSDNAANAAMQVIADPGTALRYSKILPTDPVVLDEIERLKLENGEQSFLPTKYETAREVLRRAQAVPDGDAESYERLMKLYCSMMGFVEKPGTNVDVKVAVASVMVVRDHGSDEEWAARAAEQQRELTLNAAN